MLHRVALFLEFIETIWGIVYFLYYEKIISIIFGSFYLELMLYAD